MLSQYPDHYSVVMIWGKKISHQMEITKNEMHFLTWKMARSFQYNDF